MTHTVASYCRICAASCGIIATVDGDRVESVRGDADHPTSSGYTCPKGRALPQLHHHPDRLDGATATGVTATGFAGAGGAGAAGAGAGAGALGGRDTDWAGALDDLARRLTAIVEHDGPDCVGAYLGTGLAYDTAGFVAATAWLRAIGSRRLLTPATVDNAPVLRAAEMIAGHPQANPICDFERAQLVLIIGSNPVVSHGYGTAVANPIVALRSVQQRGGSVWVLDPMRSETAAIADRHLPVRPGSDAAVLAWLVREILARPIGHHTSDSTTPADRASLAQALAPFTLERAAETANVPAGTLRALLDAIVASRGAVAAWCGTGVTMSADGLTAELLRWVLLILTDSLDTENGMQFHRGNAFAPRPLKAGISTGAAPIASRPELRAWLGQTPCVALPDEIAAGNVKALVVAGANPITAFPDPAKIRASLTRLDTLAVIDTMRNEMTALATHTFGAASQLERSDIPMHELVMARGAAMHTGAVVTRSPYRRPTWWIFAQLAIRMTGTQLLGVDADACNDDDILALLSARAPISFAETQAAGPHGIAIPTQPHWVRETLLRSAPWPIAPTVLLDRLNTESRFVATAAETSTAHSLTFVAIPRRRMHANNSVDDPNGRNETLALLNPDDAQALGIADGEVVCIANEHGTIEAPCAADPRVMRGVISLSHGDAHRSPGALVSLVANVDTETGMPQTSGFAVTVTSARR